MFRKSATAALAKIKAEWVARQPKKAKPKQKGG